MSAGIARAKNSPRLVYERLFSVFFFVFLKEGCQTRWLASLQNTPKFVAFIELFNHFPRGNQECQTIIIWHSSLSTHSIISVFSVTIRAEKSKEVRMVKKYYLALTTEEWRLMIECLNKLRNRLISESRYTDAVDEVLINVVNAKIKKFKIVERRA